MNNKTAYNLNEDRETLLQIAKLFAGKFISTMTREEHMTCEFLHATGIGKFEEVRKDSGIDFYYHLVE